MRDIETIFLNVDLDLFSRSDLQPLVSALGRRVLPLYVGRERRLYAAHLELARHPKNADRAIRDLARLIDSLPNSERRLWDIATIRDFNIGVEAGTRPGSYEIGISPETIQHVSDLKGRIVFTVYASSEPPR